MELHYRAFDSSRIQRILPNKVEYDGPKNFNEIVMVISRKMGLHPSIVRLCIRYFFTWTVFRKFPRGKKFHLRGVGQFNPWISTRNQVAKGKPPRKRNVNGHDVQHHKKKIQALVRRSERDRARRKELLKTGWE